MVRHIGLNHHAVGALGQPRSGIVNSLIPAIGPAGAHVAQALEIAPGGRRRDHGGKPAGIGRYDGIFAQAPLQTQIGNAKAGILKILVAIQRVILRFGNPPGNAQPLGIADLPLDRRLVAGGQQTACRFMHDQRWHEILEHRPRPGLQRRGPSQRGQRAPEVKPVPRGNVALGDREKARQPGFGGKQIVGVGIQHLVVHPVTDDQQLARLVKQEPELHAFGHAAAGVGKDVETEGDLLSARCIPSKVAQVARNASVQRLDGRVQDAGLQALRKPRQGGKLLLQRSQQRRDLLLPLILAQDRGKLFQRGGDRAIRVRFFARRLRHVPGIGQGIDQSRDNPVGLSRGQHFQTGTLHHQQVAGKIAAVDRGDITWLQWAKAGGVIPIEEVSAKAFQLGQCAQRRLQTLDGIDGPDPAKVAGRQYHVEIEPDVGRRGAMGGLALGNFLVIVGRQVTVLYRDKFFEKGPGLPRRQPKGHRIILRYIQMRLDPRRRAGPARDNRRQQPQEQKWPGDLNIGGRVHGDERRRNQGESAAACELKAERAPGALPAVGALRERNPLQHIPPADEQAKDGAQDRIQRQIGDAGQECEVEQDLGRRQGGIAQKIAGVAAQRISALPGNKRRDNGQGRRQHQGQRQHRSPPQRGAERQLPARQQRQQQCRARQRAPQIVQHFPTPQRRNHAARNTARTGGENPRQKLPIAAHPAVLTGQFDVVA